MNNFNEARLVMKEVVTIESIRQAKPEHIWYAAKTCWWTHDPKDVATLPDSGLPCDPRGSVLFWTDNYEGFLKSAEDNAKHYGKHGLRAFVMAHHKNCRMIKGYGEGGWSFATWDEYNYALDYFDEHKSSVELASIIFPEAEWLAVFNRSK